MPASLLKPLSWILLACAAAAIATAQEGQGVYADPGPPSNRVYQKALDDFSLKSYDAAVERLLALFERSSGRSFSPGEKGRVGLKVYADSGPGLSTPEALVEAVVRALVRRGYERGDIFLLGLSRPELRSSGFLPPLSHRSERFNQVFVRSLDSGEYYHENWFYDSPLPARGTEYWINVESENPGGSEEGRGRKSFLPVPLMHEVDFWINLPCYSDHPVLGVNGALMNATLWNASNTLRFMRSPATAPVAVAEMGAVPELRERWALNIVSLERYQFIGGPTFNSLYTVSEKLLLLSDNPVMLDAIMSKRISRHRRENGFAPLPENLRMLAFSEQLGLGSGDLSSMRLIRAN